MNIALDWDNTWTRDPVLWSEFAANAARRGHVVRIVTFRNLDDTGDINDELKEFGVDHIVTVMASEGIQKREFCEKMGWLPDVWIDDSPEYIVREDNYILGKLLAAKQ